MSRIAQLDLFRTVPETTEKDKVWDHVWHWRIRPTILKDGAFHPVDRKGQKCRVIARGALGSVMVEFQDGFRVITSRHAVRMS